MEIYESLNGKDSAIIGAHGKTLEVNQSANKLVDSWWLYNQEGYHIQDAFPYLTEDEREFILTGITADEWDELFGEEEE
jgi:calcineurin-like phosphoesterase family protein